MNKDHFKSNMKTYTMHDRQPIGVLYGYNEMMAIRAMVEKQNDKLVFVKDKYDYFRKNFTLRDDIVNAISTSNYEYLYNFEPNLELFQTRRNITTPFVGNNSSQRLDLFQSQWNAVIPSLEAEMPLIASSMHADFIVRSSCIKKATGKITLIAKFQYQFRTIYFYKLNGRYEIYDTAGMVITNGYVCPEKTDLEELPIGVEVDLNKDNFLLGYPIQYNPNTDTAALGCNVRTICDTNCDNSGDSAIVSQSFINKFTSMKIKTIKMHLNNKMINSDYQFKFPELGTIIENNILFKVSNDDGILSELIQNASISSGGEDDMIIVEDNSYISSIEVYCNSPINDPVLEKFRLELLEFRHNVYNTIADYVNYYPDECSNEMKKIKGNFEHDLFHSNATEIKFPYIKMEVVSFIVPEIGAKMTNLFGGKFTIQRVYPDGTLTDEWGRNIDLEYPATAIINRTVAGILWELFITSIIDHLDYHVKNDKISKQDAWDFTKEFCNILGLSREFSYTRFTPDELYEYLKSNLLHIADMPYSNRIKLEITIPLKKLAEKYLNYRKLTLYRGKQEKIQITARHTVGYMYILRDYHDPTDSNSSCSTVERNTQGFAKEKDSSKRDGRSLFVKKSCKLDVQLQHLMLNIFHNADAAITITEKDEAIYGVVETLQASGISLNLGDNEQIEDVNEDI